MKSPTRTAIDQEFDDYGRGGGERRKLPYGSSGANYILTKPSYNQVKRERAAEGIPTPPWNTLAVYKVS